MSVAESTNSNTGKMMAHTKSLDELQTGYMRQRGNAKGKHLIRSHAMRESASPPRTPTDPSTIDTYAPIVETNDENSTHLSHNSSPLPPTVSPTPTVTHTSPSPVQLPITLNENSTFLDMEFPKLTTPKSKLGRHNTVATGGTTTTNTSNSSSNAPNTTQELNKPTINVVTTSNVSHNVTYNNNNSAKTKTTFSNTSMGNSMSELSPNSANAQCNNCSAGDNRSSHSGGDYNDDHCDAECGGRGKKRNSSNYKGSKPRLKHMGSSSSVECNSGRMSRDSSIEQFTDQNGVDLLQFFKETLNKNTKDRNTLIRIEKDLLALALDRSRTMVKFPPMSSYNRMLIHRVAAYFGMEHNVDATQQSVIAAITKATRVPEVRFKSLIKDVLSEEPKKSILKRDTHSFDEYRQGLLGCPDRGMLNRKAKSFEEREEEYERAKRRIFKSREAESIDDQYWPNWSSTESAEPQNRYKSHSNRLLKVQSLSVDMKHEDRPSVSKSHSFGGYGPPMQAPLNRGDSVNSSKSTGSRYFTKQDSIGTSWRLSPSSSGYKTQTQSIRSDSVTPSPTGYGSGDHTPEPATVQSPETACGVVWAVTDMANVPTGSVLIDPQTLQPFTNQDGSIYHFDPSNLPANQEQSFSQYIKKPLSRKKLEKQKSIRDGQSSRLENGPTTDVTNANPPPKINTVNEMDDNNQPNSVSENGLVTVQGNPVAPFEEPAVTKVVYNNIATLRIDDNLQVHQRNQATSPNIPKSPDHQLTCDGNLAPPQIEVACLNTCNPNDEMTIETFNNAQNNAKLEAKESPLTYGYVNESVVNEDVVLSPTYQSENNVLPASKPPNVYAYPPPECDISGYFVPIYDQGAVHQDTGPPHPTPMYPTTASVGTAVMAYQQPAYNGAHLYHGQFEYAPEQYANTPNGGHIQPMPFGYPIGYTSPYNGAYANYWGQQMTYYVPQPLAANPANGTAYMQAPPALSAMGTYGPPPPPLNTGKRGSPQHHHQPPQHVVTTANGNQVASHSAYAQSVAVPYHHDSSITGIYAVPQNVYSNVLPHQAFSHHLPHQTNAVINTLVPPPTSQYTAAPASVEPTIVVATSGAPTPNSYPSTCTNNKNNVVTSQATVYSSNSIPNTQPKHHPGSGSSGAPAAGQYATSNCDNNSGMSNNSGANGGYAERKHIPYNSNNNNNNNNNHHNNSTTKRSFVNNPYTSSSRPNYVLSINGPRKSNPDHYSTTHYNRNSNFNIHNKRIYNSNSSNNSNTEHSFNKNNNNQSLPPPISTQPDQQLQQSPTTPAAAVAPTTTTTTTTALPPPSTAPHTPVDVTSGNGPNYMPNNCSSGGSDNSRGSAPRPKPPMLDLRRSTSNRNSPNTNSIDSNQSPRSTASCEPSSPQIYMTRGAHIPPIHSHSSADSQCQQAFYGAYNGSSMYVRLGQAYFTHPSIAFANSRKSPPSEFRPSMTHFSGMYPPVNMMVSTPRQMGPRPTNSNYKGNRPR